MEADKVKQLSRRIRLRLDDGTLIASASALGVESELSVIHLTLPEAIQLNLVTDADFNRVQRLLSLAELQELPVENGSASKKQRTDSKLGVIQGEDWQSKCRDILVKLKRFMKSEYEWFETRVDEKVVPDYYQIIGKPMWFNLIISKLDSGKYQSPNEFSEDIRQLWTNCKTYNKAGTPVRIAGDKGWRKFDELWLNSGLSNERSKRATAGMPAHKYEPQDFEPPMKLNRSASKSKPTNSGKTNRASSQNGLTMGHEATSGLYQVDVLTTEQRNHIASTLATVISSGDLNDQQQQELMAMLPPEAVATDAEGYIELDVNVLSDPSLNQIYSWIRMVENSAPLTKSYPVAVPDHSLAGGNDDDEDYLSD